MSKSAEERISELENLVSDLKGENVKLTDNYSQAYRKMEEANQTAMYYQGQVEASSAKTPQTADQGYEYDDVDVSDKNAVESVLTRLLGERLEPRLQAVERYATDALQQTAGREIDHALRAFKSKHPEAERIMQFDRLVMLDASEEVKRRQQLGQPVSDVKAIALEIAEKQVKQFNRHESEIADRNKKRMEAAQNKAMLPDMFASAGFEELPKAPENAKEAGDLLERLVRSRQPGTAQ